MDIKEARLFRRRIIGFLQKFDDCFERADSRLHLGEYVQGQLSDIDAKSVEPNAMHVGVAPRTLQEFMTQGCWDHDRALDILARAINKEQAGEELIAIIDETSDPKKGVKTPGVQRQWCGKKGQERIVRGERKALTVSDNLWFSSEGKEQTWKQVLVKETDRGPYVRESIRLPVVMRGSDHKPGKDVLLLVVRDPEKIMELKFFISNAGADTLSTKLLRLAHSR